MNGKRQLVGTILTLHLLFLALLGYSAGGTLDGKLVLVEGLFLVPMIAGIVLLLRWIFAWNSRRGPYWLVAMELASIGAAAMLAAGFPLRAGMVSRALQLFCLLFLTASPVLVAASYEGQDKPG